MNPYTTPASTGSSKFPHMVSSKGLSYTTQGFLPKMSSRDSSHTHFYRQQRYEPHEFERITRDEYLEVQESVSRSSLSYQCLYGKDGKVFSSQGQLKRYLTRQLDPLPNKPEWTSCMSKVLCEPSELADTLAFLIQDPTREYQLDRLRIVLNDFVVASKEGYNLKDLDHVCVILDYCVENLEKEPTLRLSLEALLRQASLRIHMDQMSDAPRLFNHMKNYVTYLGYLLMCLVDDDLFNLVAEAVIWQMTATKAHLIDGSVPVGYFMAAADTMNQITSRMLALTPPQRYKAYLDISLLLAYHDEKNCLDMMTENVIENILYRFDPYYPEKLPPYEINPADPQDDNVKLGASTLHISPVMSLMLILLKSTAIFMKNNPLHRPELSCPDDHSQSAFIWAYRFECRARDHKHERNTLTAIIHGLLRVYGDKLQKLSRELMPDVFALAVQTEVPPRDDWTATVSFNTGEQDVLFKKSLMHLSVHFLEVFPKNNDLVESRLWLLGLTYLLDPGLCQLRMKWAPPLFTDIRKTLMQVLVLALPMTDPHLVQEYGLIRRILWYIEWYTQKPYDISTLYWSVRLLQVTVFQRDSALRGPAVKELLATHGIVILIQLCYTLMTQKFPPVEKAQAVIGLSLRILTSALEVQDTVSCTVYPKITWPASCFTLAIKMMDHVMSALTKHFIVSDRWLIALLNFMWQAIVWKDDNRKEFIKNDGMYMLLDLITMVSPSTQCIALALVCDIARAGDAVDQLVTWRASIGASKAYPLVTRRGSTITALLASIFRDECRQLGVKVDEDGVIIGQNHPLLSSVTLEAMNDPQFQGSQFSDPRSPICFAAADLAGSRMSKAFALLSLLSEDLKSKVSLLDESFNLYKNVPLSLEDEVTLVLCSHFLTLKLSETWNEVSLQCKDALPQDSETISEFKEIGRGWAKEVKRQQQEILNERKKKDKEAETSLYVFLDRVRLTIALDALRELRCGVRTADYTHLQHVLIQDAVNMHHKRTAWAQKMDKTIVKTYVPKLDNKNITGQHKKVYSALPKEEAQKILDSPDP